MRDLTPEECEFIAGGLATHRAMSSEYDPVEIVVVASPPPYFPPPYYPPYQPPYYPPPPTGGGGGGGGGGSTPPPPADAYPGCVSAGPAGVSPTAVLNAAKAAAADIAAGNDENVEYGAFIYLLNGVVSHTPVTTQNSASTIHLDSSSIPDGARILGIIHNHPDQAGIADGRPSDDDWSTLYDPIANWSGTRGITVDPNMLNFIYTNEDHQTRAYDKNDRGTTTPACAI